MRDIIVALVNGLDSDNGLPGGVYNAICDLVSREWGEESAKVLAEAVDGTDDAFYFDYPSHFDSVIAEMEAVKK